MQDSNQKETYSSLQTNEVEPLIQPLAQSSQTSIQPSMQDSMQPSVELIEDNEPIRNVQVVTISESGAILLSPKNLKDTKDNSGEEKEAITGFKSPLSDSSNLPTFGSGLSSLEIVTFVTQKVREENKAPPPILPQNEEPTQLQKSEEETDQTFNSEKKAQKKPSLKSLQTSLRKINFKKKQSKDKTEEKETSSTETPSNDSVPPLPSKSDFLKPKDGEKLNELKDGSSERTASKKNKKKPEKKEFFKTSTT